MSAVLFGSISTIADTSELQRAAFNDAFSAHGLSWHWDRDAYQELLTSAGGEQRIAEYAQTMGDTVDAKAIHQTKSERFQQLLDESHLTARPGVVDSLHDSKRLGFKVALVTTTSPDNVAALLKSLAPEVSATDFDLIVDRTSVQDPKPDPAAYRFALTQLGEQAEDCVAVEDNVGGVQSARAAGITCVAFPNENTSAHDFQAADRQVDRITVADLRVAAA